VYVTANSRSSASLRSATLDCSIFCMMWIYAVSCNLDSVDIFHIGGSIGRTSDRLDFEPEKELNTEHTWLAELVAWNPWFGNGRQPEHLIGWISSISCLKSSHKRISFHIILSLVEGNFLDLGVYLLSPSPGYPCLGSPLSLAHTIIPTNKNNFDFEGWPFSAPTFLDSSGFSYFCF
jgi:hypothetical protein